MELVGRSRATIALYLRVVGIQMRVKTLSLDEVLDLKLLGVTLDHTMSFNKHVSTVVRACNFHLSALYGTSVHSSLTRSHSRSLPASWDPGWIIKCNSLLVNCSNRNLDKLQCSVCRTIRPVSSATPTAQHQLDHCYGACTGCQSGSGSTSNSPNFVTWLLLSNSQATSLIWSATVSLACCDHPHRSFCQFHRTT